MKAVSNHCPDLESMSIQVGYWPDDESTDPDPDPSAPAFPPRQKHKYWSKLEKCGHRHCSRLVDKTKDSLQPGGYIFDTLRIPNYTIPFRQSLLRQPKDVLH